MRPSKITAFAWSALSLVAMPTFGQQWMNSARYPYPRRYAQPASAEASDFGYRSATDNGDQNSDGYAEASDNSSASQTAPQASPPVYSHFDSCNGGNCGGSGCGSANGCGGGNVCGGCCRGAFDNQTRVFVDFLYLRAFGADMAQGFQQFGNGGPGTVPDGQVGVLAPDFESSFRIGGHWACNGREGITVTYTQFESNTTNFLPAAPGNGGTAASLVLHPASPNAGSAFDFLNASYGIDFRTADIEYTLALWDTGYRLMNFDIGVRYGHLQQDFKQFGELSGATGNEQTATNISFDGGGLRAGLDGGWTLGHSRFGIYGKGFVNVLYGSFDSKYTQLSLSDETVEAAVQWKDERVVPILEYELGGQWTSYDGCWRISLGYYNSFWFNTIETGPFVQAVQNSSFTRLGQGISFAGLTSRLEYRF